MKKQTALAKKPAGEALAVAPDPHKDALAFIEQPSAEALQSVLAMGDISKLTPPQRLQFLAAICRSLGLNPMTRPFDFISLQGKITIYAKKDCTEQLRKIYEVSVEIVKQEVAGEILRVTAKAKLPSGRFDEDVGAVSIKGKQGDDLANATMKAITKAKRRVTLSICGLGFLDESEIETAHREVPKPQADAIDEPRRETAGTTVEAEVVPPEGSTGNPEDRQMHWSDMLKDDEYRLVKMPETSKFAGEKVNEVTKVAANFVAAYNEVPRESQDATEIMARMALDAAMHVTTTRVIAKAETTVEEVEKQLWQAGALEDGVLLTDLAGEEIVTIKTAVIEMLKSKPKK